MVLKGQEEAEEEGGKTQERGRQTVALRMQVTRANQT